MVISFAALKERVRKNRPVLLAVLAFLVVFAAGGVLGVFLERNVGVSLSDRLARRIGTENVTVVSCARSGSNLDLTVDFKQTTDEKFQPQKGGFSSEQLQNLAYYGLALEAVREELTSSPLESGIDSVTIVCQHHGKTVTTLTGDRVPKNAGVSFDKTGKRIPPVPFTSFEEHDPDGSTGDFGLFEMESDSSQPAG
jgi:hypothetical protein